MATCPVQLTSVKTIPLDSGPELIAVDVIEVQQAPELTSITAIGCENNG